mgnify:CR=1 FL=1
MWDVNYSLKQTFLYSLLGGSFLGDDHVTELLLLQKSSSQGTELGLGDLDRLLLLGGNSGSNELEHLLLKW